MDDELSSAERSALDALPALAPPDGFSRRVVDAWSSRGRRRAAVALGVAVAAAAAAVAIVLVSARAPERTAQQPAAAPPDPIAMDAGPRPIVPATGYDVQIQVGDSATIHDPHGNAVVDIAFPRLCNVDAVVDLELGGVVTTRVWGIDSANLELGKGTWRYRVTCVGVLLGRGRIAIVQDDARRRVYLKTPAPNHIYADGRTYRISYQSVMPIIHIHGYEPSASHRLHVATANTDMTFEPKLGEVTIPAKDWRDGDYTFWFEGDGKVSHLSIERDLSAPQIEIDWSTPNVIRGRAHPGWILSAGPSTALPDAGGTFVLDANAHVLKAVHLALGVHYYLFRK